MRFLSVRIYEDQQRMDVLVRDTDGKTYKVPFEWFSRIPQEVPAPSWPRTIKAELTRLKQRVSPSIQALRRLTGSLR